MNPLHLPTARQVAPRTHQLGAWLPVPGMGLLPVNAYVIHAPEPVLVDTGLAAMREPFLDALHKVIDPARLRWIWLTHADPDHVGNLDAVMALAPAARVVTSFLGLGKLDMLSLAPRQPYLINPGQALDVGDRRLQAVAPPVYDAPESTGLFDPASGALFSADSFGAVLPEDVPSAAAVPPAVLAEGMATWARVDAPWLGDVDAAVFGRRLDALAALAPDVVLGSHLPPAPAMLGRLRRNLDRARCAPAFQGPDQAEMERMLRAQMQAA